MSERTEAGAWGARFGLLAGVTERSDGSLGLSSRDPSADVMARFRNFRRSLRPRFTALQIGHQVHGSAVARHHHVADGLHIRDDTDGHVTAERGLLLAVTIADCVPVYLARDDGSAVALLHCGWRGTAASMLEQGIAALCDEAPGLPAVPTFRLAVFLGVSICGRCYEVGPEVPQAVDGRRVEGKSCFDLRGSLAGRAKAAGIRDVSVSGLCTSCDNDRFFSHRRSADQGRQIAYLGRPLP